MAIPVFLNRKPDTIVTEQNRFESSGRIFKAASWLDFAKRENCVSALEYAALETRLAIEQLIFEQLIIGIGNELEQSEYKKCTGNAKKLTSIIEKLIPRYEQLIEFTQALAPPNIPFTKWDNKKLVVLSGKASKYLHWSGALNDTVQSANWFAEGVGIIEVAVQYIWLGLTTGNTGAMKINELEPEIFELWEQYQNKAMTIDAVVAKATTLQPMLAARRIESQKTPTPHPNK